MCVYGGRRKKFFERMNVVSWEELRCVVRSVWNLCKMNNGIFQTVQEQMSER